MYIVIDVQTIKKGIIIIVCHSVVVKGGRHVHIHHYQVDWHVNTRLCQLMDFSVLNMDLVQYLFVHRLTCICEIKFFKTFVSNPMVYFLLNLPFCVERTIRHIHLMYIIPNILT